MQKSNIYLTVDAVIFRPAKNGKEILLIRRRNEPFKGQWALPGGFVDQDEDLADAAARELIEETGLAVDDLQQLQAFGKPGRDPRHHTVSVAFMGFADQNATPVASDDAVEAGWFSTDDLPALAFDHEEIINFAFTKL